MCGRFTLTISPEDLVDFFDLGKSFDFEPRYNIAPTDSIPAIRTEEGERRLVKLRWGLHPFWADNPPDKSGKMINARVETCHKSPAFRAAFNRRRCIIPASGFYEWQSRGKGQQKQPWHIRFSDHRPMAFAGLWERWEDPQGKRQAVESCTIITGPAGEKLEPIHDRVPILLKTENFARWLDPQEDDTERLRSILQPYRGTDFAIDRVSTQVNNPRNDGPEVLELKEAK